jgi:cell division protein FtsQ
VRAGAGALTRRGVPRMGELLRAAAISARAGSRALSPKLRRRLALLAIVILALGALYMFWFRDSSLVRVEKVTVTGLSGADASRERAAVVAAARGMTTLHLDEQALVRAVGPGAAIESLRAIPDFPHGLRVEFVQTTPVAILVSGSQRVAVGHGGVLLPRVRVADTAAPVVEVATLPSGLRLGSGQALRLVDCAAAIPAGLRPGVLRIRELPAKGLVAYLRHGPLVILGSARDLVAKWAAVAAVLADPASRGASYVDARVPDRPVAGGLSVSPTPPADQTGAAPVAPAGATGATGATTGASGTTGAGATAPAPSAAPSAGTAPHP